MDNRIYTGVAKPRPGFGHKEDYSEPVKRFKKYIFSTSPNGCLIHKVKEVNLRWWDYSWSLMLRRVHPHIIATSICGLSFRLSSTKAKSCDIPAPDAVLCGRCHGEAVNFPKGKPHKISRELAKILKGCMESV